VYQVGQTRAVARTGSQGHARIDATDADAGCRHVRATTGDVIAKAAVDTGGFRFSQLLDYRDPMYTLTYLIERNDSRRVVFREDKPDSKPLTGQRVQDSFRLM
jgi:hypothetical protein